MANCFWITEAPRSLWTKRRTCDQTLQFQKESSEAIEHNVARQETSCGWAVTVLICTDMSIFLTERDVIIDLDDDAGAWFVHSFSRKLKEDVRRYTPKTLAVPLSFPSCSCRNQSTQSTLPPNNELPVFRGRWFQL